MSCWCPTYVRSRTNRSGTRTGTSVLFSSRIIRVSGTFHSSYHTSYYIPGWSDNIGKIYEDPSFRGFSHVERVCARERGTAKDNQPRLCASVCTILGSAREQRQPGRSSSYTSTRTRKEVYIKAHHQRPVKISSEYVRNTILGPSSYIRTYRSASMLGALRGMQRSSWYIIDDRFASVPKPAGLWTSRRIMLSFFHNSVEKQVYCPARNLKNICRFKWRLNDHYIFGSNSVSERKN